MNKKHELDRLAQACKLWNRLARPPRLLAENRRKINRRRAKRLWDSYLQPNFYALRELSNGSFTISNDIWASHSEPDPWHESTEAY